MLELFLITRLDYLAYTLLIWLILCTLWILIYCFCSIGDSINLKLIKIPFIAGCIISCILVFIPSTKDALIMYGFNETVEYIKSNDKNKEIPKEAIEALDKYLDILNKEEQQK